MQPLIEHAGRQVLDQPLHDQNEHRGNLAGVPDLDVEVSTVIGIVLELPFGEIQQQRRQPYRPNPARVPRAAEAFTISSNT